jgi:hypothetical protein
VLYNLQALPLEEPPEATVADNSNVANDALLKVIAVAVGLPTVELLTLK